MTDRPGATGGAEVTSRVLLDASEALLADHRPGGVPLLGTAASLDLIVGAVERGAGSPIAPVQITDVIIGAPFVLLGQAGSISIVVGRPSGRPATWAGRTESSGGCHVSAAVGAGTLPAKPVTLEPPLPVDASGAGATDIYRLFFHGPAFQVVERAVSTDHTLVARLASPRPLERGAAPGFTLAHAIEAGMQVAGLADVASAARMTIPHRVDSIVWSGERRPEPPVTAFARRGDDGSTDARIVDAAGRVHLVLRGYRTAPLPHPVAPESVRELQQALSTR
jgi:hypothetical protein